MRSKTGKNLWLQDIRKYEFAVGIIKATVIYLLILYVFYESFLPAPLVLPVWFIYIKDWIMDMSMKKETEFREQFRDSIRLLASALRAGYSVENAIRETGKDLSSLYGKEKRIRKEYEQIIRGLDLNVSAVKVMEEFALRTGQEDVESFVNVFAASKKSGGDSISVIRNSVKIITEKMDTEKEIQVLIASKRLEFNIMCSVPFLIILYMKMTFGEFLEVLYGNPAGAAVMSVCLAVYVGAYMYGRKIIRIEV